MPIPNINEFIIQLEKSIADEKEQKNINSLTGILTNLKNLKTSLVPSDEAGVLLSFIKKQSSQKFKTSVKNLLYKISVAINSAFPLNTIDPFSQGEIKSEYRIVLSTGHQFDIRGLNQWVNGYQNKNNPLTREPFCPEDRNAIDTMAQEKGLSLEVIAASYQEGPGLLEGAVAIAQEDEQPQEQQEPLPPLGYHGIDLLPQPEFNFEEKITHHWMQLSEEKEQIQQIQLLLEGGILSPAGVASLSSADRRNLGDSPHLVKLILEGILPLGEVLTFFDSCSQKYRPGLAELLHKGIFNREQVDGFSIEICQNFDSDGVQQLFESKVLDLAQISQLTNRGSHNLNYLHIQRLLERNVLNLVQINALTANGTQNLQYDGVQELLESKGLNLAQINELTENSSQNLEYADVRQLFESNVLNLTQIDELTMYGCLILEYAGARQLLESKILNITQINELTRHDGQNLEHEGVRQLLIEGTLNLRQTSSLTPQTCLKFENPELRQQLKEGRLSLLEIEALTEEEVNHITAALAVSQSAEQVSIQSARESKQELPVQQLQRNGLFAAMPAVSHSDSKIELKNEVKYIQQFQDKGILPLPSEVVELTNLFYKDIGRFLEIVDLMLSKDLSLKEAIKICETLKISDGPQTMGMR